MLGDRLRLSQVLHNLLSNAVKFTSGGFVRLSVSWQDGRLSCKVQDSGIGIQEADIGRIFSPFDQAHGEIGRRFGGTGLGLSISRSLAELMGGTLTVESQPGEGSCFVLGLPCPAATVTVPSNPLTPPVTVGGLHVLCVEDSAMNREVLAAFLEEAGVTFEMAEDGASALAALQTSRPFAAVLLDLQLPDTNGIDLASRLRTLRPEIALLAVTAQADEATRHACAAAGIVAVITKPINPARLLEALAQAITTAPGAGPVILTPEAAPDSAAPEQADSPLLADLFAKEPERLQRVLRVLSGEFDAAGAELAGASAENDLVRVRRLRHKLHSAIAGLQLNELDQTFTGLLSGDWTHLPEAQSLLRQAAADCARKASSSGS